MKCPICKSKMFVTSQDLAEEPFHFRFECAFCGHIEPETIVENINDGESSPLVLRFNNEIEFEKIISDKAYEIHNRTIREISKSISGNRENDYIVIAYLNDKYSVLGVVEEEYLSHVESARYYFEDIEDYEKCTECVGIENQLKTKN